MVFCPAGKSFRREWNRPVSGASLPVPFGRLRQVALPLTKAVRGFQPENLTGEVFPLFYTTGTINFKDKEV